MLKVMVRPRVRQTLWVNLPPVPLNVGYRDRPWNLIALRLTRATFKDVRSILLPALVATDARIQPTQISV